MGLSFIFLLGGFIPGLTWPRLCVVVCRNRRALCCPPLGPSIPSFIVATPFSCPTAPTFIQDSSSKVALHLYLEALTLLGCWQGPGLSASFASKGLAVTCSCHCGCLGWRRRSPRQPTGQPVAEVIPHQSLLSSLPCPSSSSTWFGRGWKAEDYRQAVPPHKPAWNPCLSFSTLYLYLVFPFSEDLGSQHLLLP